MINSPLPPYLTLSEAALEIYKMPGNIYASRLLRMAECGEITMFWKAPSDVKSCTISIDDFLKILTIPHLLKMLVFAVQRPNGLPSWTVGRILKNIGLNHNTSLHKKII